MRIDTERSLFFTDKNEIKNNTSKFEKASFYFAYIFIAVAVVLWILYLNNKSFSGWYGSIAFLLAIVFAVISALPDSRVKDKNVEAILASIPNFNCSEKLSYKKLDRIMAIDKEARILCLLDRENRFFTYPDVLGFLIVEDGIITRKKFRVGNKGRALIDNVPLSKKDEFLDGLSEQTSETSSFVKCAYLKLLVNDPENPFFEFHVIQDEYYGGRRTSEPAMGNLKLLYTWAKYIDDFIDHADKEEEELRPFLL
ncbi:hypothetical protein [Paenibacillus elgii]|uniref:hypothetical protein n=1 Tax=Paenibacillus elgii TaxID=189691 RepID=UPI001EF8B1D9|nr:hypothetical protein [Paenibacillus elgii]